MVPRHNRLVRVLAPLLMLLTQGAALCSAQLLEQVTIDAAGFEYRPLIVTNNVAVQIKRDGSFVGVDIGSNQERWVANSLGDPILSGSKDLRGEHFAALSSDGTWRVWDFVSSRLLKAEPPAQDRIISVQLSPDGKQVLLISLKGQLTVFDLTTDRQLKSVSWSRMTGSHRDAVVSATAFDTDGTALLIGTNRGALYSWTLSENRVHQIAQAGRQAITAIATTKSGGRWAAADASGMIYASNSLDTTDLGPFISVATPITHLEFDSTGKLLL